MRVLERNSVLSYDRNRPVLRAAVKSDVSKPRITTELVSYGRGDLCDGRHFLLQVGFQKAESKLHGPLPANMKGFYKLIFVLVSLGDLFYESLTSYSSSLSHLLLFQDTLMHFMYPSFQQILIDFLLMGQDLGWALGVGWIRKYLTLPIGNAYSVLASFKRQYTN